jgi:hypothetical protein
MSFYVRRSDGLYESTELTRGPWNPSHQHAGPPTALLVGRLASRQPDRLLGRAAIELLRPIPMAPLRLELDAPAGGRRVQRVRGALVDASGTVVMTASLLLLQVAPVEPPPPGPVGLPPPLPDERAAEAAGFPFFPWPVGYHTAMELRFGRGRFGDGPVAVWMRPRVPLVEGEAISPLERLLCAVDSAHGVSWQVDPREMSVINPDLTVALHRQPVGDWICLDAETANERDGVGVAHSRLWDERGPVGWSLQSLVLARAEPTARPVAPERGT